MAISDTYLAISKQEQDLATRNLKIQLGIPLTTDSPNLSAAVSSLISASSAAFAAAYAKSLGK